MIKVSQDVALRIGGQKLPVDFGDNDWNYDWSNAFGYLGVDLALIERVLWSSQGQNDEKDWVAVVKLTDGRYGYVESGCDYTGWDCQAWGWHVFTNTLEDLIPQMSEEGRDRLKLPLPEVR